MTATGVLREEHCVILKALDVLEATAERLVVDASVPEPAWSALLDWFGRFADARHHAKEERLLFPALEAAGVPRAGGPIGVMLEEHDLGRALVRGMWKGPAAARAAGARTYVDLLRAHIHKENDVLFELADVLLDARAVEALARDYAAADREQGPSTEPAAAEAALARLAVALELPVLAR
jgi:hemerythrin-like domain-containing protein